MNNHFDDPAPEYLEALKVVGDNQNQLIKLMTQLRMGLNRPSFVFTIGGDSSQSATNPVQQTVHPYRCKVQTILNSTDNDVSVILQDGATPTQIALTVKAHDAFTNLAIPFSQNITVVACTGTLLITGEVLE